jgi:hypothetical protein
VVRLLSWGAGLGLLVAGTSTASICHTAAVATCRVAAGRV